MITAHINIYVALTSGCSNMQSSVTGSNPVCAKSCVSSQGAGY